MRTLRVDRNSEGLPRPSEIHLVRDDELPPRDLITGALGLFFYESRLRMVRLPIRGWDVPGGHIEDGESADKAVRREVEEEAAAKLGAVSVLGYEKIEIHAPKPIGYRYPLPTSYQVFYCGVVAELQPFKGTSESAERGLFSGDKALELDWVRRNRELYDAAIDSMFD